MTDSKSKSRLVEVDALRGLAALAVVLFHYTTRFTELFAPNPPPTFSFPDGRYGVNLFFIISGFVIFMTLEKASRPMDFVVSRFSRLFPAYWVAIILTLSITHLLGLPGISSDLRFRLGPDMDTLSGNTFRNGCHLTAGGLDSAAKMWATTISADFPAMAVTR